MGKETIKVSSGSTEIDFSEYIIAIDDKPMIEVDRDGNEVKMTLGRILGNLLANYRPQPDPSKTIDITKYDAIRAVELARKIYKAERLQLMAGDIDFILDIVNLVPLVSPIVEEALKSTLKKARLNVK